MASTVLISNREIERGRRAERGEWTEMKGEGRWEGDRIDRGNEKLVRL